jgi:hypothetical protein
MKKLLWMVVVSLWLGMSAGTLTSGQEHGGKVGAGEKLLGAWKLVWLEEEGSDGKIHKADCTGLLVYTRDGHMSVQVMFQKEAVSKPVGSTQYAQGGYEASYGTYKVDEGAQRFIFHVEGALVRNLVGKDLTRAFEITGNQMIVKSTKAEEHWRVAWERY